MTGVDYVHDVFEFTGKGIKVAVIDTGVDYTHPALGGCFGPGCRVSVGYNYVDNNSGEYHIKFERLQDHFLST
jgi:subtilisin family serine protease